MITNQRATGRDAKTSPRDVQDNGAVASLANYPTNSTEQVIAAFTAQRNIGVPLSTLPPLTVRVETSAKTFGEVMNQIRTWLDHHKIRPVEFKSDHSGPGSVAFELRFQREDDAHFFERAFS